MKQAIKNKGCGKEFMKFETNVAYSQYCNFKHLCPSCKEKELTSKSVYQALIRAYYFHERLNNRFKKQMEEDTK